MKSLITGLVALLSPTEPEMIGIHSAVKNPGIYTLPAIHETIENFGMGRFLVPKKAEIVQYDNVNDARKGFLEAYGDDATGLIIRVSPDGLYYSRPINDEFNHDRI